MMSFDLETYISRYSGYTKLNRLLHILKKGPPPLQREAYMLICASELNVETGTQLVTMQEANSFAQGQDSLKDLVKPISSHTKDAAEGRVHQELIKLKRALNDAQNNNIKESIRMAHNDYGDFYGSIGRLNEALKSYSRTRDYCTNNTHIVQMCLNVVRVSIDLDGYNHVRTYVPKAEDALLKSDDKSAQPKLAVSMGLCHLREGRFQLAAERFLTVTSKLGNSFTDVISCEDVAVYGGLCALATFDRSELKSRVLSNSSFKALLELVPRVRELVNGFYEAKYADVLRYMRELEEGLGLDIHISGHVQDLYQLIRNRALVQYVSPYSSVDLKRMAEAFCTQVSTLEKELVALIVKQSIQARIDSQHKVLHSRVDDQRSTTYRHVLDMGEKFCAETMGAILRVNLLRDDIVHTPRSSASKGVRSRAKVKREVPDLTFSLNLAAPQQDGEAMDLTPEATGSESKQ